MMTKAKKQIRELKELLDNAEMKLKTEKEIRDCYRQKLDVTDAENKLLRDRDRHLQAEVDFYRSALDRALGTKEEGG